MLWQVDLVLYSLCVGGKRLSLSRAFRLCVMIEIPSASSGQALRLRFAQDDKGSGGGLLKNERWAGGRSFDFVPIPLRRSGLRSG